MYSNAVVLQGAGATLARIAPELDRHEVFSFAGHSLVDNEFPERTFLVVAPSADDARGMIHARNLG
jgi:hypothetical protein